METSQSTSVSTMPRDVFMYLLVLGALVVGAVSAGSLLFDLVNVYVPDALVAQCQYDGCASAIRWALAMLIVAMPVLIWAWLFIRRDVTQHPEKASARMRRWLLYFTLFVAGCVLLGDTIALIYNFLQGELTLPFLLKILVVGALAGTIFFYFLRELHQEGGKLHRIVAWVMLAIIAAAVVTGVITAGLPSSARAVRFDERRVTDLQNIQNQIVYTFWQSKGRVPQSLDELADPISSFMVPMDPETKAAYEYTATGERTFKLCAVFVTDTTVAAGRQANAIATPAGLESWAHGAGRVCFDRTIDPEVYRIKN